MLRFGDFVLDRDARQLFRGGIQVHLPQALELLDPLVSARPKTLPKSAIRDDEGSTSSSTPPASRAVMPASGWRAGRRPSKTSAARTGGGQAVSAPTPIADGALRVGRVALVFRSEKDEGDTVTDNR
jgi:hypothetical protein